MLMDLVLSVAMVILMVGLVAWSYQVERGFRILLASIRKLEEEKK